MWPSISSGISRSCAQRRWPRNPNETSVSVAPNVTVATCRLLAGDGFALHSCGSLRSRQGDCVLAFPSQLAVRGSQSIERRDSLVLTYSRSTMHMHMHITPTSPLAKSNAQCLSFHTPTPSIYISTQHPSTSTSKTPPSKHSTATPSTAAPGCA